MSWDADANRISFSSSTGGTTGFVYDTTAGIPAVIEEVNGGSVYYVREPNGALVARIAGTGTGQTTRYYHFDALGSTRLLTGSTGAVTDTYSYDAWGVTSHDSGSTSQPYQYVGQLGYYTHYQDENMNLLQLGVRFYDPSLGRFTQVDPLEDGLNLYAYVDDSPVLRVDPSGRIWCKWVTNPDPPPPGKKLPLWEKYSLKCNWGTKPKGETGWQLPSLPGNTGTAVGCYDPFADCGKDIKHAKDCADICTNGVSNPRYNRMLADMGLKDPIQPWMCGTVCSAWYAKQEGRPYVWDTLTKFCKGLGETRRPVVVATLRKGTRRDCR